jgi:hypothetical protein
LKSARLKSLSKKLQDQGEEAENDLKINDIKFNWGHNYDAHIERVLKDTKYYPDSEKGKKFSQWFKDNVNTICETDVKSFEYSGEWNNAITNFQPKMDGSGIAIHSENSAVNEDLKDFIYHIGGYSDNRPHGLGLQIKVKHVQGGGTQKSYRYGLFKKGDFDKEATKTANEEAYKVYKEN